jgi:hypothetical protein
MGIVREATELSVPNITKFSAKPRRPTNGLFSAPLDQTGMVALLVSDGLEERIARRIVPSPSVSLSTSGCRTLGTAIQFATIN